MKGFLYVVGVLGLVAGVGAFALSQTERAGALHEIEGLLAVLIGVCGLGFSALVDRKG